MAFDLEMHVAELKAIECWDDYYYMDRTRDSQAVMAYTARQKRRHEIIELIQVEAIKRDVSKGPQFATKANLG
jgi:hypothetical protein